MQGIAGDVQSDTESLGTAAKGGCSISGSLHEKCTAVYM